MSKFLKAIVNIILILAILVAGGLLIPPFVGVTTVIVDDVNMDTNLEKGSVTYALEPEGRFEIGSDVLVTEGDTRYVYKVRAINIDTYILEDKLSVDGETVEKALGSSAKEVVLTIPYIGYVSMALKTTEGLIIVGLAVIFVIILFILAEIWKNDEEEDDEDDDDDEDEDEETGESSGDDEEEDKEEPQLSRREQKKAQKAAAKAEKAAAKAAKKAAKKAAGTEDDEADINMEEEHINIEETEEPAAETAAAKEEADLFAETENILAADIASMLGEQVQEEELSEQEEPAEAEAEAEEPEAEEPEAEMTEPEEKKLAIPVYTKEELLLKAKAAGEEPNVLEDEVSGVTLLDYSDIL